MVSEYEAMITPTFVNNIFDDESVGENCGRWVIVCRGKLVSVSGKLVFDSRQQATKAFYNGYRWRFGNQVSRLLNGSNDIWDGPYRWWSDPHKSERWKTFKKILERDYGFKIIQI